MHGRQLSLPRPRSGTQIADARAHFNGYSGAFGYNLSNGVTIVVEATKSETATTDASAFDILREVAKYVTPATPINFRARLSDAAITAVQSTQLSGNLRAKPVW